MSTLPPLTIMGWLRHDLIWEELADLPPDTRILEIGAGRGALGARLARRFRYTACEADGDSAAAAKAVVEPWGVVHHGDSSMLPAGAEFDVVCAFEVLEHIADDGAALDEWRARLRPGGRLVLSVPAYQEQFGPSDVYAGHYRRYAPGEIEALLARRGFVAITTMLYGFPLGYLAQAVRHRLAARHIGPDQPLEERTAASGRWLQPKSRIEWTRYVTAPFRLLRRRLPTSRLGTALVVVARREG